MAVSIPTINTPFLDNRGAVTREWYLFLVSFINLLGGVAAITTIADLETQGAFIKLLPQNLGPYSKPRFNSVTATTVTAANVNATTVNATNVNSAKVTISSGTLVSSQPALDITQAWNNGGLIFEAVKSNITVTAANLASKLFTYQVGGVDRLSLLLNGKLIHQYDQNGKTENKVINNNAGAAASAAHTMENDAGHIVGTFLPSAGYAGAGIIAPNRMMIYSEENEGIAYVAANALGVHYWADSGLSQTMRLDNAGLKILHGFGCNGANAQISYPAAALGAYAAGANGYSSGAAAQSLWDTVASIQAALNANGIMI